MELDVFTGGIFDTNCFFLKEAGILVDAPQDAAGWLARQGYRVKTLLLTHGHIDHVWDAARVQEEHGCRVAYHAETEPMVMERGYFQRFGFNWEVEPVKPGELLTEAEGVKMEGVRFDVLEIPGHCPGSLCFYMAEARVLFGGDVLFAGSIGRTDLPGGNHDLLLRGIREKLWALPDETVVLPGHGPATRIGVERRTNPFLH